MEEVEVEAVQVLHRKLKFRTVQGSIFPGLLDVYESETPYVLICKVTTDHEHSQRMDVHKEDLASELRQWLEGKVVRNPVIFPPKRIDEAIQRFVKFGKPPLQEDLVMWILSRSELQWAPDPAFVFGGISNPKELGSMGMTEGGEHSLADASVRNPFAKTADAAIKSATYSDEAHRAQRAYDEGDSHLPSRKDLLNEPESSQYSPSQAHHQPSGSRVKASSDFQSASISLKKAVNLHQSSNRDDNPHQLARLLIGTSAALAQLKVRSVKGREGAKEVLAVTNFTPYHWKLASEIEKARKEVDEVMDARRKEIQIARARKKATHDKYAHIRKEVDSETKGGSWFKVAEEELKNLRRVKQDIEDDLLRQRTRAHREAQKIRWTLAPSGFGNNRMGKSKPGVVLGPGPIPCEAMGQSADPYVERTLKRFYWDSAGRRHVRQEDADVHGSGSGSVVERAMDVIQKAAKANGTANLDLQTVFEDFDSSGNGELSIEEMQSAFLALGVQLEVEQLVAVFNHFDPNGSGGVRVGEFVWAFFNRRGLVRQWRRRTDKLTDAQIRAKFHAADTSGDGKLSAKEFAKFLKSFGVVVTSQEQAALTAHFDTDGDGMLDLDEFKAFIVSEMMRLNSESNNLVVPSGVRGGSGSSGASSPLHHSRHSPPTSNGENNSGRRPQTAVLPLDMAGDIAAGEPGSQNRAASAGSLVGAGPGAGRSRSLIEQESESAVLAPEFVASALRAQFHVEQKLGNNYYREGNRVNKESK